MMINHWDLKGFSIVVPDVSEFDYLLKDLQGGSPSSINKRIIV